MDMVFDEGFVIGTIYAENAYEASENWTYLHEWDVRLVVRFKSNTVAHINGCLEIEGSAKYWIMM